MDDSDTHPFAQNFNQIPRFPQTPAHTNKWHFSIERSNVEGVEAAFLFIINPYSRVTYTKRLSSHFQAKSSEQKAREVAIQLLRAFSEASYLLQRRPWAWCADAGTRGLLGTLLREWGIKDGLEVVQISSGFESEIARQAWEVIRRSWADPGDV